MSKIKAVAELFLGKPEINRMINFLGESGFRRMIALMSQSFGVVDNDRVEDSTSLQIYTLNNGKVGIRAGQAIDEDGNMIDVQEDIEDIMTLPDNNSFATLFISYAQTNLENLKVDILSSYIYGKSGEDFTEKFVIGSNIEIVNSTLGNNGVYQVKSVNSVNEIEIDTTLIDEQDVGYICQGRFTPSVTIPEDDKRPIYLDSFLLSLEPDETKTNNKKFALASVSRNGSIVTIVDLRSNNIHKMKSAFEHVFNKQFTTADSFRVGADELGLGGRYVLLQSDMPNDILNIRIVNIYAGNTTNLAPGYGGGQMIPMGAQGLPTMNNNLNIRIKWGWDYIKGTGGTNSMVITNTAGFEMNGELPNLTGVVTAGIFTNNILVNYFLWVPQVNKLLKITSNTGNTLQLEQLDGSSVDLTGVNPTLSNPAWITVNADKYDVVAVPYNTLGTLPEQDSAVQKQITYSQNSIPMIEATLSLEVAKRYKISVRAWLTNQFTEFFEMPAGGFFKYGIWQTYANLFLVVHPQISSTGASIGSAATQNGFRIAIIGWTDAQNFEIVYTTDNAGASFTDPTHPKLITTNRIVDISTNSSATYNIKVRPLIANLQVGTPLSTDVVSGSSGLPPNTSVLINQEINLRTYSGSINFDGADTGTLSAIVTPSGGSKGVVSLPTSNIGKIMVINGQNYIILSVLSGTSVFLQEYVNDDGTPSVFPVAGNYTFSISTSKRGRRMATLQLPQDFSIVKTDFDCQALVGAPEVTVRVYQKDKESFADVLVIEQSDTPYSMIDDVVVISAYGARILIVDFFDPTIGDPAYNEGGVTGRLVVYGTPIVKGLYDPNILPE